MPLPKNQETEARSLKRNYREMALNMASAQCNRFEHVDPRLHARDVVHMASTYYDWLWAAKLPPVTRNGHGKTSLKIVKSA